MPSNKSEEYAVLLRRTKVAELYLKNNTQWDIAHKLDITQSTVCEDLNAIRRYWLEKKLRAYDEKISEELAKIDKLEVEALNAWEASKQRSIVVTHQEETGAVSRGRVLGPRVKKGKTVSTRYGDARLLNTIQWCIETRLKLIGALNDGSGSDTPALDFGTLFKMEQRPQEQLVEVEKNGAPEPTVPDYLDEAIQKLEKRAAENQTVPMNGVNGHTDVQS